MDTPKPVTDDRPVWKSLYEAALFELDQNLLPQKIEAAQRAIAAQALLLMRANQLDKTEQHSLASAHLALED
jgi:hypothetical protein